MSKYGLSGKFKTKTGKGAEFVAILLQASHLVAKAKGCQLYMVAQDKEDPDAVWAIEVWDSETDHDNSLNLPGVRDLISQAMPLLEGRPEGHKLEVLNFPA